MPAQLRLYTEADERDREAFQEPAIRICLEDLLPLLTLAKKNNYLWLHDFLHDEVMVTPDLYDVLRSFHSVQRTSA